MKPTTIDALPTVPDDATLGEAKEWLRQRIAEGARCPCCTQFAKEYRRKLNSGMAFALVRMYQLHGTSWQDKTITLKGAAAAARDESLLRHWGLLEEDKRTRADGGHAGWWRVTDLGEQFIQGRVKVRSHVVLYDNRFRGLNGFEVTIEQCLGSRFSRAELMALRAA